MKLYRVFPWDTTAKATAPGGPLYVADSAWNRISNLDLYATFYVALEPEAAIAEALGGLAVWRAASFRHPVGPLALATYHLPDDAPVFDLDSLASLALLGIKHPSHVTTRNRTITQGWARSIYLRGGYVGARWWSYYNPDWHACGLWDCTQLTVIDAPHLLTLDDPLVVLAATHLVKQRLRLGRGGD